MSRWLMFSWLRNALGWVAVILVFFGMARARAAEEETRKIIALSAMWSDFDYPAFPTTSGTPELGSHGRNDPRPPEARFPWKVNQLADVLPGKLYDVRSSFESRGVKFGPADFAWFNPEGLVLIVRASKTQTDSIETGMAYSCGSNSNLLLDGEIAVVAKGKNDQSPEKVMPWSIRCTSGARTNSAASGEGLSYRLEFEPTIGPDSMTIDCVMVFEAKWEGKTFSLMTKSLMYRDKPQTTILGTTKDGEKVELRLKLTTELILPASKFDDATWKASLLDRVQKLVSQ